MKRLIEWLLIFFIIGMMSACASTQGRLNSKYRRLSGYDKMKEAPMCIWHHNCNEAGGMFSRLAGAK